MTRLLALLMTLSVGLLSAQNPLSVSSPEADNSPAAEMASFQLDERLQVNLFADESHGIANPVCFEWDAHDRLWVLCTWAYPQVKPNARPNDKLIILEDRDGNGRADHSSVFMDGLDMPTGFALGHGGVYIGEGHDLIHAKDTDGDGKADKRELIFTGFGTGDTHQNINSFAWSPGGELFFCQGLHCFSYVQTPWGNRVLEEHGSWRLRPLRRQLNSYRRTSGGGNPWGYAFGAWGEPFIKSNSPGVSELLPSLVQTDHIGGGFWGGSMQIGSTKIKSMIIEIVDSPHLPDDLQGDFLIAGYFARNVARLRPHLDGAGHRLERLEPILTSTHNAFRPVDLNIGPDGALYVADWFNPIIGHYQASLRHPDRDVKHGRIWRITAKDRPLLKSPKIGEMNANQLVGRLNSPRQRNRYLAKQRLMELPKREALSATRKWLRGPRKEHDLFGAIGVFESHETVNAELLDRLLQAKDHRARAYATRVAGRWHDRLDDPLKRLRRSATDAHARVRLETIVAVSEVPRAESVVIACQAAEGHSDKFIDFALTQAIHGLAEHWKPALIAGQLKFEHSAHLTRVISRYDSKELKPIIRERADDPAMLTAYASLANTAEVDWVLDRGLTEARVIQALEQAARERNLKPSRSTAPKLIKALDNTLNPARIDIINLCSQWQLKETVIRIRRIAIDMKQPQPLRQAAIEAIGRIGGPGITETLVDLADGDSELALTAISGLAPRNISLASTKAVEHLPDLNETEIGQLLSTLLARESGAAALAKALDKRPVPEDTAKLMRRWLNTAGRYDDQLNAAIGETGEVPAFDPAIVAKLSKESLASGNAENGKRIFQHPMVSCTACHEVDGIKGATSNVKGPNLSAVAAGLPIELLVESLLWPARQIKEGYQSISISTKDGRFITGFADGERGGLVRVRDITSGHITTIRRNEVKTRNNSGSMMPQGLTASLTQQELRDLIKFLSTLKTQ
ncbi:MAG: PVC-type heme-binding CxxCH protein [Limisphaerales bacterium]